MSPDITVQLLLYITLNSRQHVHCDLNLDLLSIYLYGHNTVLTSKHVNMSSSLDLADTIERILLGNRLYAVNVALDLVG